MNSRERVVMTLNHQQPDRVPVDMGATPVTSIAAGALSDLRKALKLENRLVKVHETLQMLGMVEEDVVKALGIDIVGIWSPNATHGYRNTAWKPWQMPDGTNVLVGGGFTVKEDSEGNTYIYPQGDTSVPPSGKMPKGGLYFDNIVRQEEFDEDNMNGREDFKEQFSLLTAEELQYYNDTATNLYNNTECAIIGNFRGSGFGDSAQIPGASLKRTPGIRKVEEWLMAHYLYPNYIREVYDYQLEIAMQNLNLYKQAVGDKIQMIFISGTDFGTQNNEFISPDMFREFYKPYYKTINDWVHKNTSWKTFYHSCGSIVKLLDDFVDMGADIINPVQCSASGMDPQFLKDKYGDKLTFWGGAINTQKTLPFGTPGEVKKEATERLRIFSKNGGFIYNAIHNIQRPTPIENILAFFEAVNEFNNK